MLSLTRQQKIRAIVVAITMVGILFFWSVVGATKNKGSAMQGVTTTTTPTKKSKTTVRVINPNNTHQATSTITATGEVLARQKSTVSAQTSGVIQQVPVEIGAKVQAGDRLAVFKNVSQQADVQQAKAKLQAQKAKLSELKAGPRKSEIRNAMLAVESAQASVIEARTDLFNMDIRAYAIDAEGREVPSGSLKAPTIYGTYNSSKRGKYKLSIYPSKSKSGYSFEFMGLERGFETVSTDTPVPLGDRGLYIKFPKNFSRSTNWVVPVPNTRSSQFANLKSSLKRQRIQLKRARNKLQLKRKGSRNEQIEAARAQVSSARARLQKTQAQLSQTTIQAPFPGTVLSVSPEVGEFVSAGQKIAKIVNRDQLEVRTFVSPVHVSSIKVGDAVQVNSELSGRVTAVAPAVTSDTGNIEIRIRVEEAARNRLIPGTFVDLTFTDSGSANKTREHRTLPLSSVETTANGAYVFTVSDGSTLHKTSITVGDISGDRIVVTGEYPDRPIVKDTAGLSPGQSVDVKTISDER